MSKTQDLEKDLEITRQLPESATRIHNRPIHTHNHRVASSTLPVSGAVEALSKTRAGETKDSGKI